jgi:NAD+ kinase
MFSHIAIAAHPYLVDAQEEAHRLAAFLSQKRIDCECGVMYDENLMRGLDEKRFDLWIALGGDGTMLRSGQLCGPANVPVLGINMGRLGFLMGMQREEWPVKMEQLLADDYWLEPRLMLKAAQFRQGKQLGSWHVLNEAIVSRADIVRPVQLVTFVDDTYLTTYVADGLIAATPTGSTAYALAARGPILPPQLRNFLIVPVAPHLSFDRAIVLAEGSRVIIQVETLHKANVTLDGHHTIPLKDQDRVTVQASEHTVHFVRLQSPDYFYRNLTSKMNTRMKNSEANDG